MGKGRKAHPTSCWDAIPKVKPDEIDLQMLKEIEEAPDRRESVPAAEGRRRLGLA